jgi:hypothetical protein
MFTWGGCCPTPGLSGRVTGRPRPLPAPSWGRAGPPGDTPAPATGTADKSVPSHVFDTHIFKKLDTSRKFVKINDLGTLNAI